MSPAAAAPLLTVEHLTMRFGGLTAIDDLSFVGLANAITAIIGPNGAGKTTVFNCLTGFYKPTVGRLTLHAPEGPMLLEQLDDFRVAQRAHVARTFQNIRLFAGMSVLENLMVAQHNVLMRASLFTVGGLLGLPGHRRAERAAIELARDWLERVDLIDRADDPAGTLPYGAQRRLEIARAMCTRPRLLCLDEPAAGLNAREFADLNQLLLSIRAREKIGILLIEHDMSVVMGISDHIVVLDYGRKIAEGTPKEVRENPAVIRAYLGTEEEEDTVSGGAGMTGAPMLRVAGVHTFYGRIHALHGVDLEVAAGEIVTLIGANGAGKSTLLMTVCGNPHASKGRVELDGQDITTLPTFEIVRRGIAIAPEGRRIFPRMTVHENLQMGATTGDPAHFAADLDRAFKLFPILAQRAGQRAGTLSGGEQQMLAIARALMSRPRLLLLDEPSLGLAPLIVRQIFQVISEINRSQGITVLLVEQNAFHALRVAHRGYVIANGKIELSGTGKALLADPKVRAAYLEGGVA